MVDILSDSEQLRAASRGRPGASERSFGGRTKYVPTLNSKPIPFADFSNEDECFDLSKDAKHRAKQFRDYCLKKINEEHGECP